MKLSSTNTISSSLYLMIFLLQNLEPITASHDTIQLSPGYNALIESVLTDTGLEGAKVVAEVMNREYVAGKFLLKLEHCTQNNSLDGESTIPALTSPSKRIRALGAKFFHIDIHSQIPTPLHCYLSLVNGADKVIATREIALDPQETCLCVHSCKCACGDESNLRCEPLSIDKMIAAGIIDEFRAMEDLAMEEEHKSKYKMLVHWILLFHVIITIIVLCIWMNRKCPLWKKFTKSGKPSDDKELGEYATGEEEEEEEAEEAEEEEEGETETTDAEPENTGVSDDSEVLFQKEDFEAKSPPAETLYPVQNKDSPPSVPELVDGLEPELMGEKSSTEDLGLNKVKFKDSSRPDVSKSENKDSVVKYKQQRKRKSSEVVPELIRIPIGPNRNKTNPSTSSAGQGTSKKPSKSSKSSKKPSKSSKPSKKPSKSSKPSKKPSESSKPSKKPSESSKPSKAPSKNPSKKSSKSPSKKSSSKKKKGPTPTNSGGPQSALLDDWGNQRDDTNMNGNDDLLLNYMASTTSSKTSFGTWNRRKRDQFTAYDYLPQPSRKDSY